jgi:hypothetical protein
MPMYHRQPKNGNQYNIVSKNEKKNIRFTEPKRV